MKQEICILSVNGSPRRKSNTAILMEDAVRGARDNGATKIIEFNFSGKTMNPCLGMCSKYCRENGACVHKDDFATFVNMWREADGILMGAPVYHMGPPAQVKAALDRLGHIHFSSLKGEYPRFCKVGGALAQGGVRYGGQEIVIQQFIAHFLLMNCVPVTGDMPESYLGVGGMATSPEMMEADTKARDSAYSLGKRVAELTRVVKTGFAQLREELPGEYFVEFGRLEEHSKGAES